MGVEKTMRIKTLFMFVVTASLLSPNGECLAAPRPDGAEVRRPIALAVQGNRLFVANRENGTMTTVDTQTRTILRSSKVGRRLSDLAALGESPFLLATDEESHSLLLVRVVDGEDVRTDAILPVAKYPVRVVAGSDRSWAAVSSLWSRRLTLVNLESEGNSTPRANVRRTLDLDFAPRELIVLPSGGEADSSSRENPERGERLLVADAFGGRMIVVDPKRGTVVNTLSVAGHHLRGLALHPAKAGSAMARPSLLVAHQTLNSDTSTTHEHVFWGGVIGNRLRSIELSDVYSNERRETAPGSVEVLGRPSFAAGDPGRVAVTKGGVTVVALSGIDEVAVRRRPEDVFSERSVGKRPTAVVLTADERTACIANTLDDSISFLDLATLKVTTMPLGESPPPTAAQRGERLFYDSRLSLDGWYSCHSCHTDGHTNGLLNDNLGDEYFGAPKKILSLLGTTETSPWAWNGGAESLEAQLKKSLTATMQSDADNVTDENVAALKAYLSTLAPPPGLDMARDTVDRPAVARGEAIFRKRSCSDCHPPSTYTTPGTFDVGIHDERGLKAFNPPSLRGVSQRAPYFHDNRAAELSDVFVRYRHGLKEALSDADRADLLAFLRSL